MDEVPESIPYRMERVERDVEKLDRALDDLREHLNAILVIQQEVNHIKTQVADTRHEQAEINKNLSGRIDTLLKTFGLSALSIFVAVLTFVINSRLG